MIDSAQFSDKRILVIDKQPKNTNDRTWCFWEKESGYFEDIIYHSWETMEFKSDQLNLPLSVHPYKYKMIRGIDFYNYCLTKIRNQPNIIFQYGELTFDIAINYKPSFNGMRLDTQHAMVFNSIYVPQAPAKSTFRLQQHFKGWIIRSSKPVFDPSKATLMDFRVDQSLGTTFVYVLPLSTDRALIEYTLFNKTPMNPGEYDGPLRQYIENILGLSAYTIVEEELGVIPMSSEVFPSNKDGMFYIGTAGGQTKASTGYTFRFIQKQADAIVQQICHDKKPPVHNEVPKRFRFYDNTLLHILSEDKLPGKQIFEYLFNRNKANAIFKFLDNETSLTEELKIISTLPKMTFMNAGIKEFWKLLTSHYIK